MAHHGDQPSSSDLLGFPRALRAMTTPPPPPPPSGIGIGISLQPVSSAEVSLASPRPDGARTVNEYVETPFRPPPIHVSREKHHQTLHLPIGQRGSSTVVTKQPTTFKKDAGSAPPASNPQPSTSGDCFRGSIICPECGRCRCESCRKPRPLPSRWLCNNACFCSAETTLDYASCLCCVKGLFYHCSKDYELDRDGSSCADDPCSCGPHRLKARWGCLGVLSLILPCLWCYWPLKGCVGLCEKCYARYSSEGCRCEPRHPKLTDVTPEKRLLDTSPDF